MDQNRTKFDAEVQRQSVGHVKWFTQEDLTTMTERVRQLKLGSQKKTPNDYKLVKRYDVIEVAHFQRLILAGSNPARYFVALEDVYNVIKEAHAACGNGDEKLMEKELHKKYANVTRQQIKIFLALCQNCTLKKAKLNKGVVVRPILSNNFNSRGQVDLIDFQSQHDGEFR
ncbi:KRAB-A domain-containing protein 2-like [Littorina saxatilis]|uniref:KRAB-A domain-containing protein 2-like n=1 Tax=Littorina saxatilis TaxID=31220 RepID=UPI0038B6A931